jgi:hypothetical protein
MTLDQVEYSALIVQWVAMGVLLGLVVGLVRW